jgi:HEAT repeat protein
MSVALPFTTAPGGGDGSDVAAALMQAGRLVRRPGFVVLLSDLLVDPTPVADAVSAAVTARLEDSKRIESLIKQLQDPAPEKCSEAIAGLQQAQGAAVGPLLQVLADPARASEHAAVRAALVAMGRLAREPLMAILERADPKLMVQAILVLAEFKNPKVEIALVGPALSDKSDAKVRAAAAAALKRLTGHIPDRSEAVRLLTATANAYFDRQQPLEGVLDGKVDLWRWDEGKRQCVAKNC